MFGRQTASLSERQAVLDSVAFWNYADGHPLDGHSTFPREADLGLANRKLKKVVAKLEPDLVILMSIRLWPYLSRGDDAFAIDPNANHGIVCQDNLGDVKEISFLRVRHPTRGFRQEDRCAIGHAIEALGGQQPGILAEEPRD
ncbi:MAG: hypothetical protein ACLQU1_22940 [Bryobacteraceae bacterium]